MHHTRVERKTSLSWKQPPVEPGPGWAAMPPPVGVTCNVSKCFLFGHSFSLDWDQAIFHGHSSGFYLYLDAVSRLLFLATVCQLLVVRVCHNHAGVVKFQQQENKVSTHWPALSLSFGYCHRWKQAQSMRSSFTTSLLKACLQNAHRT